MGANVTTYADTGLSASTQYWYRVRAYNSGLSDYSNSASATTLAPPPQPPAAPTNLNAAVASSSQINLTWSDNASNETGVRIERSSDGTSNTYGSRRAGTSPKDGFTMMVRSGTALANVANSANWG